MRYGVLTEVSNKTIEKQCPRHIQTHMNEGGLGTMAHSYSAYSTLVVVYIMINRER